MPKNDYSTESLYSGLSGKDLFLPQSPGNNEDGLMPIAKVYASNKRLRMVKCYKTNLQKLCF